MKNVGKDKNELETVLNFFSQLNDDQIRSIYLYGSILTETFSDKSDLDLFIILKNSSTPIKTIDNIMQKIKKIPLKKKIDWDIVFENETKLLYFKKSNIIQYYTIAKQGRCVYGQNILENLRFDPRKYYECVVGTAQKIRHELLNHKSVRFWARKLRRDVLYGILSLEYLDGADKISFDDLKTIEKKYPNLKGSSILLQKKQKLRDLWQYSESLRVIVEEKMGRCLDDTVRCL